MVFLCDNRVCVCGLSYIKLLILLSQQLISIHLMTHCVLSLDKPYGLSLASDTAVSANMSSAKQILI